MKLFLVRHGETEENVAGMMMGHRHGTLTEKGKAQARETAEMLKNHTFAHIYSSDLNRAADTAKLIKEFHSDTPLTFTEELRERNLGVLQGQPSGSVDWSTLPGDGEDNKKPENGESMTELRARAVDFVRQLYKKHSGENILLVSHNGWIKHLIAHFKGVSFNDIDRIGNAQVIEAEVDENLTGKITDV
jgi:phosphoserine phosphatase